MELIRTVQLLIQAHDPALGELISPEFRFSNDPRQDLIHLLDTVKGFYAERSSGTYGEILNRVNHFVTLPSGGPVQGLSVMFSPTESEIFRTREIDLANVQDRSEFIVELDRIIAVIRREAGSEGESNERR